ncbi:hypothetical protein V8C40DRAFT_250803, partial [Trichoderma camerunense]
IVQPPGCNTAWERSRVRFPVRPYVMRATGSRPLFVFVLFCFLCIHIFYSRHFLLTFSLLIIQLIQSFVSNFPIFCGGRAPSSKRTTVFVELNLCRL